MANRLELAAIRAENVTGASIDGGFDEERVRRSVFAILESNVLCSIATVTPEGHPHINSAYFGYSDDLELYFLSHPGSLHCRNLSRNASMAMTVFNSAQRWTEPGQGLQLFGTGARADGRAAEDAERIYGRRFPAYASWKAALAADDLSREYRFYRFDVGTVRILDEKNLGDAVWVRVSVRRGESALEDSRP